MKVGIFSVLFQDKSFEEMLDYVANAGVEMIEIGTGGNPGNQFCPLDELLNDEQARKAYLNKITSRGLEISALSCHNNPISPNQQEADTAHDTLYKTIKLAALLDVPVVNTFSGIAGADDEAKHPNWPVTPWPTVYSEIYDWQWHEKTHSILERSCKLCSIAKCEDRYRITCWILSTYTLYFTETKRGNWGRDRCEFRS
ncbi:IolE protein -like protein [Staphylococcus gallinarum]|uniref:IolE protein -like protein n=1 Tax=Staphylococcus gallinarum TaxID=1293 RepID=A0A380FC60_STAGA|nr:IolE protein -like protein [Staphylococcus gallinarum]